MNGEPARRALCGLLARRERWGLTWRGRLTVLVLLLAAGVVFAKSICGFLSVSSKVSARHLVVEGWVSTATLRAAAAEFQSGGYETVYSLGGTTDWDYHSTHLSDTYASVAAARLAGLGIPRERIRLVPAPGVKLDRTFASALALKKHLEEAGPLPAALNIMTDGVHSRRSRLLFEKAFGEGVAIGVLSTPDQEFDADRWWTTSEGLKEVISETGAYLYARLFFRGGDRLSVTCWPRVIEQRDSGSMTCQLSRTCSAQNLWLTNTKAMPRGLYTSLSACGSGDGSPAGSRTGRPGRPCSPIDSRTRKPSSDGVQRGARASSPHRKASSLVRRSEPIQWPKTQGDTPG